MTCGRLLTSIILWVIRKLTQCMQFLNYYVLKVVWPWPSLKVQKGQHQTFCRKGRGKKIIITSIKLNFFNNNVKTFCQPLDIQQTELYHSCCHVTTCPVTDISFPQDVEAVIHWPTKWISQKKKPKKNTKNYESVIYACVKLQYSHERLLRPLSVTGVSHRLRTCNLGICSDSNWTPESPNYNTPQQGHNCCIICL